MKKEIISLCKGMSCTLNGAEKIHDEFEKQILEERAEEIIKIDCSSCKGLCHDGPNLSLLNKKRVYSRVKEKDVKGIVLAIKEEK